VAYNFVHKESSAIVITPTPLITLLIGPISLFIIRFVYDFSFTRVYFQRAVVSEGKGKAVPLQAWGGSEGSRKLR
jgi:hypothetical protein